MPTCDFFARFGLFVAKDFLDADLRLRILSQAGSLPWNPAWVWKPEDGERGVDQQIRNTLMVTIPDAERMAVVHRLESLKPSLERHFKTEFSSFAEPQLLRYGPGHFFAPHSDRVEEPGTPGRVKNRCVSLTTFLNDQSDDANGDSYSGGSLVFYGLIDDPRAKGYGFPLAGKAGELVAFRSDLVHEVKPVICGDRYTIVTWFSKD